MFEPTTWILLKVAGLTVIIRKNWADPDIGTVTVWFTVSITAPAVAE
jgi:hypothetical protein